MKNKQIYILITSIFLFVFSNNIYGQKTEIALKQIDRPLNYEAKYWGFTPKTSYSLLYDTNPNNDKFDINRARFNALFIHFPSLNIGKYIDFYYTGFNINIINNDTIINNTLYRTGGNLSFKTELENIEYRNINTPVLTYNIKSALEYKNSLTKNTWFNIELPINYIKFNILKAKKHNLSVYQISPNISLNFQLTKKIYLSLNTNYTISKYKPNSGEFYKDKLISYGWKTSLGYNINNKSGLILSFSYINNKDYTTYSNNYNEYYISNIEFSYYVYW